MATPEFRIIRLHTRYRRDLISDIMDQLIAGHRDPKVLAQLARGRARRKLTELEHAWKARSSSPAITPPC